MGLATPESQLGPPLGLAGRMAATLGVALEPPGFDEYSHEVVELGGFEPSEQGQYSNEVDFVDGGF